MKKKGLIISTVVMAVVLIASLTTATYAWFSVSAVTKLDQFNVSVKSNNAVNIGFDADSVYSATATADAFKTGTVTYTAGTPGTLGGGSWEGDTGLSATINHNIKWGDQSKAIGFSSTEVAGTSAEFAALTALTNEEYVYAASLGTIGEGTTAHDGLVDISAAIANNDGDTTSPSSDYVYLFMGVSPAKTLTSDTLIILVDSASSQGTTLGILSALHVAYRLNSAIDGGAWTDVDIFGADDESTPTEVEGYHYGNLKSAVTCNLTADEKTLYNQTYGATAPEKGAYALKIDLPATAVNAIDQIEILIYIDGNDDDCNNSSINNAGGTVSIFFNAIVAG